MANTEAFKNHKNNSLEQKDIQKGTSPASHLVTLKI